MPPDLGNLGSLPATSMQSVTTKPQIVGGRTRKVGVGTKRKVGVGRGAFLRGWSTQQPGYHDRGVMLKQCGRKCFLGPHKTFPICSRNTCKVNRKGVYAAYIRAREYMTIKKRTPKYKRIASTAKRLLRRHSMYTK
jgi:hypothetical protein